jgi:hypothetical protein
MYVHTQHIEYPKTKDDVRVHIYDLYSSESLISNAARGGDIKRQICIRRQDYVKGGGTDNVL